MAAISAAMPASAGRHDLAAVAEIDLVAVVLRRVVAGRHHDAGVAAEVADREGQHRRGQPVGEHDGAAAGGRHDGGGVAGEDVGVVPRVVPDHDARRRSPWACRYAVRPAAARITTERFIRCGPAPSSPRSPAVPNSSSPQNRSARSASASPSPARAAVDHGGQLGPGHRVRVVGAPGLGPRPIERPARAAHSRRTTSASIRPQRSAAARPASSTSAWLSGWSLMPAARLVTSDRPSTSSPACRAAMASIAVDMPDQVGAEHPGHPDLGRRLVLRPAELRVDALGQVRLDLAAQRAQPGRVEVGQVDELRALDRRDAGQVEVVADQHRGAGGPVAVEPAAAVGEDDDRAARRRPPSGRRGRPRATPLPS